MTYQTIATDRQIEASTDQTITLTKLSPNCGVEVGGVDLTKPLSASQVETLRNAVGEHCVIFFRDQKISIEDHTRFASYFGKLHHHVGPSSSSKVAAEHPAVRKQHFDKNSKKVSGEVWHTDQSCAPIPPMGSILYNHIVPPDSGGDTLFANMYAAYEGLTPRMKAYLDGLTATHDGRVSFGPTAPVSDHPIIVRHPVTGRRLLFVNECFTTRINGLPDYESEGLLNVLFEHCRSDEWSMRFHWREHSIAFWDNRCAQHKAIWDYWPHTRSGYRVQIQGDAPPVA